MPRNKNSLQNISSFDALKFANLHLNIILPEYYVLKEVKVIPMFSTTT